MCELSEIGVRLRVCCTFTNTSDPLLLCCTFTSRRITRFVIQLSLVLFLSSVWSKKWAAAADVSCFRPHCIHFFQGVQVMWTYKERPSVNELHPWAFRAPLPRLPRAVGDDGHLSRRLSLLAAVNAVRRHRRAEWHISSPQCAQLLRACSRLAAS